MLLMDYSLCFGYRSLIKNNKEFFLKYAFCTAIIIVLSFLCYYNSCKCDFVFDDIKAIKENKDIKSNTPIGNIFLNDYWGSPIRNEQSHKSYRPLTVLSFRLNYYVHKLNPYGYHLFNIILHTIVCLLFRCFTIRFLDDDISFRCTLLFVVHPIHTEAVAGVVGRAELLSSIFYLLAFMIYDRMVKNLTTTKSNYYFVIYSILYAFNLTCAMLSKEQGITISGVCLIYELFIIQNIQFKIIYKNATAILKKPRDLRKHLIDNVNVRNALKRIMFLIIVTGSLLYSRILIMGSNLPTFTRFDNPSSNESFPAKQLTLNYLIFVNFWLLILPSNLCCDWTMGTIPIIKSFYDLRNLLTLIVYSILISLIYKIYKNNRRNRRKQSIPLIMGLTCLILPFLPASNLFFQVGFVIAERVLYMPSMGFCILIGYGSYLLESKKYLTNLMIPILTFLILVHGLKSDHRTLDWHTELTLFKSGLKITQQNAKLFNNVGHALENDNRHLEALSYYKRAIEIQTDDVGAYINVGRAYKNLKMFNEAEQYYRIAKSLLPHAKPGGETYHTKIAPNYLNVFISLANLISMNDSRLEEADYLYRQAISMRSDYIQAYINRGDILMKLNRTNDALNIYKLALQYENDNPDLYYNIGVVLLEQNNINESLKYFEKAIEINSEHEKALLNSAILMHESGNLDYLPLIRFRLGKLLDLNENNDLVLFNLGMLAMDDNDTDGAIDYFKRAIELNKNFKSAFFNLSLLLVDSNRALEALKYLIQLLEFHPNHVKGLILLGDIYMNHIKNIDEAELCYKRIIEIEPENIQGLHNLCVVYVERNDLEKALPCLENVHKLAPNEEYIINHLNIVKTRLKKKNQNKIKS